MSILSSLVGKPIGRSRYLFAAISLLSLCGVSGCRTHIQARHVPPPPDAELTADLPAEGIYYYLPKTVLRVTMPVSKTTETPGPFADLAQYFFVNSASDDIISKTKETYEVNKDAVTVVARGVKDPAQMYVVKPTGGLFADTKFHFVLNEQYVPSAMSAEVTNNSVDFAFAIAETTASLFAKAATGGAASVGREASGNSRNKCVEGKPLTPAQWTRYGSMLDETQVFLCNLKDDQLEAVLDVPDGSGGAYADVLRRWLTTNPWPNPKFCADTNKKPSLCSCPHEAGAPPSKSFFEDSCGMDAVRHFLKARSAFVDLQRLRNVDDSPQDIQPDVYKAATDARTAKIRSLTGMFFGITKEEPSWASVSYDVEPGAGLRDFPLLKIATEAGICRPGQLSGVSLISAAPTYTEAQGVCATATSYDLSVQAQPPAAAAGPPRATSSSVGRRGDPASRTTGLRYRIPGIASVVLKTAKSELYRQLVPIAQFGPIATLPQAMGGQKAQYDVKFDAFTGALMEITTANAAVLNADMVKRAGTIAGSGIAAQQAIEKQNTPSAEPTALAKAQAARKLKQEELRLQLLDQCLKDSSQAGCSTLSTTDE